ncbi:MAG: replicative DNA helicase [Albidovulum sp.]|nr:replicative DNA helicase [Albidovulum sp.]
MNKSAPFHLTGSDGKLDSPEAPRNVPAEQALLGAIMTEERVFENVSSIARPEHFYDPIHRLIYEIIIKQIGKRRLVTPDALMSFLQSEPGLAELGGREYLVTLAASAVSVYQAAHYAKLVVDCAMRRNLIDLGEEVAFKAGKATPDSTAQDLITDTEKKLYNLAENERMESEFVVLHSAATEAIVATEEAYKSEFLLSGLSTGFKELDKWLGGLQKSDLVILAGRPAMGKTALATNIAFRIARTRKLYDDPKGANPVEKGGIVGFFSLEMSSRQLASRILSEISGVSADKIRKGQMEPEEFHSYASAAREIEQIPLLIDDTPALNIAQITSKARRLKRTKGLDVLFIDYLQLIRATSNRENRTNEVSEITQGLKALAKELDIPVVALSQLSRQVEGRQEKRPQLSDLRESGSIEQDADVVMFVYREQYYVSQQKPNDDDFEKMTKWKNRMNSTSGIAEVIFGKQRHGPVGTANLHFNAHLTAFGDPAKKSQVESKEAGYY